MDLTKSRGFFDPDQIEAKVHIVGCGSVGSTVAELLARSGVTNFVLYDFDVVESKNIVNQMFTAQDVGKSKVDAVERILKEINPEVVVAKRDEGWHGNMMSGYIFLCPDSINVRREVVEKHRGSPYVKAMFDFRTGLTNAQHYAADWSDDKQKENFIKSMGFTDDEADRGVVSACGETLGVAPTVRIISAYGVSNFMNFVRTKKMKKMILADAFDFTVDAFGE